MNRDDIENLADGTVIVDGHNDKYTVWQGYWRNLIGSSSLSGDGTFLEDKLDEIPLGLEYYGDNHILTFMLEEEWKWSEKNNLLGKDLTPNQLIKRKMEIGI